MPVDPLSGDRLTSGGAQRSIPYPSPFFDIASTFMPSTPKALFRFCRYYYYTVGAIGAAIDIHAVYPITDLVIDETDEVLKEKWEDILTNKLKIVSSLIEAGKEYGCYGNSFNSINTPKNRFLVCPSCNNSFSISSMEYKFRKYQFEANCPKCNFTGIFKIKDVAVKDLDRVNMVRWNPENIDIQYNPITGNHRYLYKIPGAVRKAIMNGSREFIETVPKEFIDAVKKNVPIVMNPRNLFHLKRGSIAEQNQGWGEPFLTRCLKDVYYLQILKKAREAVAQQHIVPLWVLFPTQSGDLNPYEHINLAEWRGQIESEIKRWKKDPNYIPVMPMPLGFQFIGGDFKNLDTTPETQNLLLNILASMNMPQEFVYGGLQYSGTSFSIRMLSNLWSSYRAQICQMINGFVIPTIAKHFEIKPVKVHFTDLRMADDMQRKASLIQLNQMNKVSTGTLLSEYGIDATKETEKVKEELKNSAEIIAEEMVNSEKAKAEAALENVRGQVKIQAMQQKIMRDVLDDLRKEDSRIQDKNLRIKDELWQDIFKREGGNHKKDDDGNPYVSIHPNNLPKTVKSLAMALSAKTEEERAQIFQEMVATQPMMAQLVQGEMSTMPAPGQPPMGGPMPLPREGLKNRANGNGSQQDQQGKPPAQKPAPKAKAEKPLPEQRPPRRAGSGGEV